MTTEGSGATATPGERLPLGLLVLRLVIGAFLFQWTIEKFINIEHTTLLFNRYYGVDLTGTTSLIIGSLEMVLVIAFVAGAYRRVSYGLVLFFTAISVGSTWDGLIHPFTIVNNVPNHIFAAGVPLLAAVWMLYYLRDLDTRWSWDARRAG